MSSFPTHHPARSESNHEAVRTPDLESRSTTLFLGRAWLTVYVLQHPREDLASTFSSYLSIYPSIYLSIW